MFEDGVNLQAFSVFLSIVGGIMTVFFVNKLGKRFLTLFTLSICSLCYIFIGLIGIYWTNSKPVTSWLVLILYLTTTFMSSFGIMPIGWILLTEIFPMKWVKNMYVYNHNFVHDLWILCYIICLFFIFYLLT